MPRVLFIAMLTISAVAIGYAQSGRRSVATPTPFPISIKSEAEGYSESKPRSSGRARVSERFPGIGAGTILRSPVPSTASGTANPAGPDAEDSILRVETNLVTIPVSVFDKHGLYIPGLRQKDFKIFEDGVEQEIAYFGTTDKPFTVALLLDTSPSTEYKIDEIHAAAEAFVNLLGPNDRVIVIEFNSSVKVQQEATTDRVKIVKAINRAKFGDGTSLYNAVDEALRKQLGKVEGRKAVVLFTDGVDTTSRKNSYDGTLSYAEETDSLIFPIYYDTYFDSRRRAASTLPDIFGRTMTPSGVSASDYAFGKKYLEDLAEATGGRVFTPEATPGGLTAAFEGIAEELRRQYNIGFIPKGEGRPGQRKIIKVRVNRPNLVLRARDSYVVGTSTAPAPDSTPASPTAPKTGT